MSRGLPVLQLDDVRIASPCNMSWEDMTGSDRVRFCAACQKNVFNLSGMRRSEAQELLAATEGKICARMYRRKDGTVLTADCPVGLALVARRAKRMALSAAALSFGAVAAVLAFLSLTPLRRVGDLTGARTAVVTKVRALEVKHSELVVPEPPHESYAGGIGLPPSVPTPKVKAKRPPPRPTPEMGDIAAPTLEWNRD